MKRVVAVTALVLALTACGGSDDTAPAPAETATPSETPSTEPVTPEGTACADIWVEGQTLPEDYETCELPDGNVEAGVIIECDSGTGALTEYDNRYYALLGGTIGRIQPGDDSAYQDAYEECFADEQ